MDDNDNDLSLTGKFHIGDDEAGGLIRILNSVENFSKVIEELENNNPDDPVVNKMKAILGVSLSNAAAFLEVSLRGIAYKHMGANKVYPEFFTDKEKKLCKAIDSDFKTVNSLIGDMSSAIQEIDRLKKNPEIVAKVMEENRKQGRFTKSQALPGESAEIIQFPGKPPTTVH